MDRERLRLSHMQNGMDNIQICDNHIYYIICILYVYCNLIKIIQVQSNLSMWSPVLRGHLY